nr:uncharacterized protein LOC117281991 [Nicotiana tomentosiformis]
MLGSVKLNTDGACVGMHVLTGIGGVFRNSTGHWMMGYAGTTTASTAMERILVAPAPWSTSYAHVQGTKYSGRSTSSFWIRLDGEQYHFFCTATAVCHGRSG